MQRLNQLLILLLAFALWPDAAAQGDAAERLSTLT